MAQSEATVTTPSPTPPTNMSFTGTTGPNPPNYSKNLYIDYADNSIINTPANNPYYDDGTAGSLVAFAANTAALTSGVGSAATAGGTEGTYPGTAAGAVPAATSVPHEGAGTEVVNTVTYPPAYTGAVVHNPLITVGVGPQQTAATILIGPNGNHPSAKAPAVLPTITNLNPNNIANGAGQTSTLVITGTGFRPDSVVNFAGVPQPTTYVSATSLKVFNAAKRSSAGSTAVTVVTGGTATAPTNWTFT